MKPSRRLLVAGVCVVLLDSASALAATIVAVPSRQFVGLGDSFTIDLFLDLEPGEEASVFEGRFELDGLGSVLSVDSVTAGGATWDSAFHTLIGSALAISALSSNTGGSRLVASLGVTAIGGGTFRVLTDEGSFAQRDIPEFPFLEDVPIDTAPGTEISRISTTPVPALPSWGGLGVAALFLAASRIELRGRRGQRAGRGSPA